MIDHLRKFDYGAGVVGHARRLPETPGGGKRFAVGGRTLDDRDGGLGACKLQVIGHCGRTKLTPEQRATVRAARLAQTKEDRKTWRFWAPLAVVVVMHIPACLLTFIFLLWTASFAPNGWFAWAFAVLCSVAAALAIRAGTNAAIRRRDAWLAGEKARSDNWLVAWFMLLAMLTGWSAIAATYVSNFGATSSELGPKLAAAMFRFLLHGHV